MENPSHGWADLLHARLNSLAEEWTIATNHPTLLGGAREKAVAELLRGLMPRRFEVLDGALAVVDEHDKPIVSSDQYDIVIADTWQYPTLFRIGTTVILPPEAAHLVFEIKSELANPIARPKDGKPAYVTSGTKSFAEAMTHLGALSQHARHGEMRAVRILFSYQGCMATTLCEWLDDLLLYREDPALFGGKPTDKDKLASGSMPDVLALLEHGVYAWKVRAEYNIVAVQPAEVLAQVLRDALSRVFVEDQPKTVAKGVEEREKSPALVNDLFQVPPLHSLSSVSLRFGRDLRTLPPAHVVKLDKDQ